MKRGLVLLDPAEIVESECHDRVRTLQVALRAEGVDVGLIYGDVYRADDIAYLTNLCIYWNEGVLAVPVDGEPSFLMKLSARVHPWMRQTSMVSDLRSGRSLPQLIAEFLAERSAGVAGLVSGGLWPAQVTAELAEAVPEWTVTMLGDLVARQRDVPSTAELALIRTAGRQLTDAVTAASGPDLSDRERRAMTDRVARDAGFLDVFCSVTPGPDGAVCMDVTGQHRHHWVRMARIIGPTPWATAMSEALNAAVAAARPGATTAQLEDAAAPALTGADTVRVEWINQAELATGGDFAPRSSEQPLTAGAVGTIVVEALDGDQRAVVADTIRIADDGLAERITG